MVVSAAPTAGKIAFRGLPLPAGCSLAIVLVRRTARAKDPTCEGRQVHFVPAGALAVDCHQIRRSGLHTDILWSPLSFDTPRVRWYKTLDPV